MTGPGDRPERKVPIDRRCTGHRKDGQRCKNPGRLGANVCWAHGGNAPQVLAAAERRIAEAKVMRLIGPYTPPAAGHEPVNVWEQLAALVGEVTWLKGQLAGLVAGISTDQWRYQGAAGEQLRAEVALYERALDRTSSLLVACGRLNIETKLADLAEKQAEAIVLVLIQALDRLGLGDGLREAASDAVYAILCEFAGTTPKQYEERKRPPPPTWEPAPLAGPLTPICELAAKGVRGAEHQKCARATECQCECHRRNAITAVPNPERSEE